MRTMLYALVGLIGLSGAAAGAELPPPTTLTPPEASAVSLDAGWKEAVYEFTQTKLAHSAWGLAHSRRNYRLAAALAGDDGVALDRDVLFAAAFLHDMGGFAPYAVPGVDHAVRSAAVFAAVLRPLGFPEDKLEGVRQAILTHSYYCEQPPTTPEAVYLHDADSLDFLGPIAIARIISLTERERVAPSLTGAFKTLAKLLEDAPVRIIGPTARRLGVRRAGAMRRFLATLKAESFGGDAL